MPARAIIEQKNMQFTKEQAEFIGRILAYEAVVRSRCGENGGGGIYGIAQALGVYEEFKKAFLEIENEK